VLIDKYNLLSHYAVARAQAFKPSTIISAFRKCGIWPLDEGAVPAELFEPALNYTTEAAQPLAPRLPSLLVSIAVTSSANTTHSSASRSSVDVSTSSAPSSTVTTATTAARTSSDMGRSSNASTSIRAINGTSRSSSSATTSHSSAVTVRSSATVSRPSTPPLRPGDDTRSDEVVQALYKIALPSPLRKTASRKALAAENEQLRAIARAAGVELEKNFTQMVLMVGENGRLRKQLYAKKNKPKRAYTTGHARLMTGDQMRQALLEELHKKKTGECVA